MKLTSFFKRNVLFTIGVTLYLGVALFKSALFLETLRYSLIYFKELFEILPLIVLIATVIDAWIPTSFIIEKMGKESGPSGAVFAYIVGSISAGPIYASFPIVKLLMEKGASVSNAVIIISSWAVIKVPMLINEVKFLGFRYMAIRWVLTIIAIYIMGRIIGRWVRKEEILTHAGAPDAALIAIEPAGCIGCGLCVKLAPQDFAMMDGKGTVKAKASLRAEVMTAKEICPGQAIRIKK